MNGKQHVALAFHCRFAFETAHPRFVSLVYNARASLVLTVNSGYE